MFRRIRRRGRGFAPRLAAGLALAQGGAAQASPEDVLGFGARSSAMGATGAAAAEGYEAVHANPALLSLSRERRLTQGLAGAIFDLRAGDLRLSHAPLRGSVIGATVPIPFGDPAGLCGATGVGLPIGYGYASNRLRTNGRDSGVRDVHGLAGGLVVGAGVVLNRPLEELPGSPGSTCTGSCRCCRRWWSRRTIRRISSGITGPTGRC